MLHTKEQVLSVHNCINICLPAASNQAQSVEHTHDPRFRIEQLIWILKNGVRGTAKGWVQKKQKPRNKELQRRKKSVGKLK
jgi:hypothetical protein